MIGSINAHCRAMEVVQECNGLLKIEDILPFFPEFVTIDDFQVSKLCCYITELTCSVGGPVHIA